MGRIADFTLAYPDEFLSAIGLAVGFGLATAIVDVWGGIVAGPTLAFITFVMSKIEPKDPALGPHQ